MLAPGPETPLASRKLEIWTNAEREAPHRRQWRARADFFHEEDNAYLRFLIAPALRVLEIGCGTGDTLAMLQPSFGVGIDFSKKMIEEAKRVNPHLDLRVGDAEDPNFMASLPGPFDVIMIVDTLGVVEDIQALFETLHPLCTGQTRLVITYYSHLWQPLLRLVENVGWRMPQPAQNVVSSADLCALTELGGSEPVKSELRLLSPLRLLGIGRLINRYFGPLPIIRSLCLRHYLVARSTRTKPEEVRSASVIVPARNEAGNIEPAVTRIPSFCDDIEIIFVEGHSEDETTGCCPVFVIVPPKRVPALDLQGFLDNQRRCQPHQFGPPARRRHTFLNKIGKRLAGSHRPVYSLRHGVSPCWHWRQPPPVLCILAKMHPTRIYQQP